MEDAFLGCAGWNRMTSKIAHILEILGDGKWHRLSDVRECIGVSDGRMLEILSFLSKYEFLEVDYVRERVRMEKEVKEFMAHSVKF